MTFFSSNLLFLYTVGIALILGWYFLYLQFTSLRWSESEMRLLERLELHLSQVLRLLDAPDVKMLLQDTKSRQRLFLSFSNDLRKDVWELLRSRKLDFGAGLFALIFLGICTSMRFKAHVFCGINDLRFLSGMELALMRRTEGL